MRRIVSKGNALTEYSLCISLVALTTVAGLKFLGNSVDTSLTGVAKDPAAMHMMNMDFNHNSLKPGGSVSLKGGGYYYQSLNAKTGEIEFITTTTGNGETTNATSLDGNQWNSMGQFQVAESLIQLAEKQTDPQLKSFIMKLAEKAYYMGAAEGEIDAVEQLQQHDPEVGGDYGKINALVDIKRLQEDILSTLQNPPEGMDQQVLLQVNALSLDAYNIAQSYVNVLKSVPDNSQYSFNLPVDLTNGPGNGSPGQALATNTQQITYCTDTSCGTSQAMGGPKVEDVYAISYLRTVAKEILSGAGVAPETVVATFNDANTIDDTKTTASKTN